MESPLAGVIGVVSESIDEVELANKRGLGCIEVRADLLLHRGVSEAAILTSLGRARELGLGVLFTPRHPSHGGKFAGSEQQRVRLCHQAVAAGAQVVDLESDSEASVLLQDSQIKLVLSSHDFSGMPDQQTLDAMSEAMERREPWAVKIVPTAATVVDALMMLMWTAKASADSPIKRIGFAMGSAGQCSRILTTAFAGLVSYASFGESVAPGQVDLDAMMDIYRVSALDNQTTVTAVYEGAATASGVEVADKVSDKVASINQHYMQSDRNAVAIGFSGEFLSDLELNKEQLRISDFVAL